MNWIWVVTMGRAKAELVAGTDKAEISASHLVGQGDWSSQHPHVSRYQLDAICESKWFGSMRFRSCSSNTMATVAGARCSRP